MANCTNCGATLSAPTTFCPNCGAPNQNAGGPATQPPPAGGATASAGYNAGYSAGTEHFEEGDPPNAILAIILAVPLFFCCQPGAIAGLIMAIIGLVQSSNGQYSKARTMILVSYIISGVCWALVILGGVSYALFLMIAIILESL